MSYTAVSSAANPLVKEAVKIKKRPDRQGGFLVEGPHLIEAALAAKATFREVFFTAGFRADSEGQRLARQLSRGDVRLIEVPEAIFSKLSDTETPQGILAVATLPEVSLEGLRVGAAPLLAVCDALQDPGNVGTIVRSADAAGADAVVLLPGCADAFGPKALRATAGSIFTIPVVAVETGALLEFLSSRHIPLWGADTRAELPVFKADLRRAAAVAIGNEARGLSEPLRRAAARLISIPIAGKAESLNAAMAATVILYEALRQRQFKEAGRGYRDD